MSESGDLQSIIQMRLAYGTSVILLQNGHVDHHTPLPSNRTDLSPNRGKIREPANINAFETISNNNNALMNNLNSWKYATQQPYLQLMQTYNGSTVSMNNEITIATGDGSRGNVAIANNGVCSLPTQTLVAIQPFQQQPLPINATTESGVRLFIVNVINFITFLLIALKIQREKKFKIKVVHTNKVH